MAAKTSSASDPRERLLHAAFEEIEARGLARVTVRGVAAAAGVNIAAVSYYFRSKELLVQAALESTLQAMVADVEAMLARFSADAEAVLVEILTYYFEGMLRYPRLSKAHMHAAFLDDDYDGQFPNELGSVLSQLAAAIRKAVPSLDARTASQRVVTAYSSVCLPAVLPGLYSSLDALSTPGDRVAYVRALARTALAPAGGERVTPRRARATLGREPLSASRLRRKRR